MQLVLDYSTMYWDTWLLFCFPLVPWQHLLHRATRRIIQKQKPVPPIFCALSSSGFPSYSDERINNEFTISCQVLWNLDALPNYLIGHHCSMPLLSSPFRHGGLFPILPACPKTTIVGSFLELFHLTGMFFLQISTWLAPSVHSSPQLNITHQRIFF